MSCSDELSQSVSGGGNTNNPARNRSRVWFFTWNNHTEESVSKILSLLKPEAYAMQEETGEKKGTTHLQGVLKFKTQVSFTTLLKVDKKIHWERCKDWKASVAYCTKIETRSGKVWTAGVPEPLKDPLEGKALYPYQQEIIDMIKGEPDDRKIYWYWEATGCTGKTSLCKHLAMRYGAMYVSGKANDVKFAIAEKEVAPKIVLWDIPRCSKDYLSWEAIESVKNGIFFAGKYESKQVMYNAPHLIIFANFPPDVRTLSMDRWEVREIKK